MSDRRLWQLEGDLRQAFENYCGGMVSGPWDLLIETLAEVVEAGEMNLETGARINLCLARTQGAVAPDECPTCNCCMPGMVHP